MVYWPMCLRTPRRPAALAALVLALAAAPSGQAGAAEPTVFMQFTKHVISHMSRDKEAFAQASTCLSWFYKASKTPPPPAVQGISWRRAADFDPDQECRKQYPGGMDTARDMFAKHQALLSVCLTVYEFALVADRDDNRTYSVTELQDLLQSLSLPYDPADSSRQTGATLTARFDQWYRTRSLDDVMKGMGTLYERGYRMTSQDRAELNRVMQ